MKVSIPSAKELLNSLKSFREIGAQNVFVTIDAAGWAMHDFADFEKVLGCPLGVDRTSLPVHSGVYPVMPGMGLEEISVRLSEALTEKWNERLYGRVGGARRVGRPAPA